MSGNLLYPIFLNLKDKQVLVVGGGMVAYQKLLNLINTEARLTVIAPTISEELRELDGEFPYKRNIRFYERDYQWGDEKENFLVIAATDLEELNISISNRCQDQGILVCNASSQAHSDFFVPSVVESGDIKIALSTGGKAPSVLQKLRKDIQSFVGTKYANLVQMVSEFRDKVHDKYQDPSDSKKRTKLVRWFTERLLKSLENKHES